RARDPDPLALGSHVFAADRDRCGVYVSQAADEGLWLRADACRRARAFVQRRGVGRFLALQFDRRRSAVLGMGANNAAEDVWGRWAASDADPGESPGAD